MNRWALLRKAVMPVILIPAILLAASPTEAVFNRIATLESFEGKLTIKSHGVWGVKPETGLALYHGDKIQTADGRAHVVFHDGAVLDVNPNSTVRITEMAGEERALKLSGADVLRREVRLFVGKVKYKSAERSGVKSVLVAPSAVAALRGTETWFGTDGKRGYIDLVDGDAELGGDVVEVEVPEVDADTARKNTNYMACQVSEAAWRAFEKARRTARNKIGVVSTAPGDGGILLASNRPFVDPRILAQAAPPQTIDPARYYGIYAYVVGLLAEYVRANATEDSLENETLLEHPDPVVSTRAEVALEKTKAAMEHGLDALELIRAFKERIANHKERMSQSELDSELRAILNLIRVKYDYLRMQEQTAGVLNMRGEIYTIGVTGFEDELEYLEELAYEYLQTAREAYQEAKEAMEEYDKALAAGEMEKLGPLAYRLEAAARKAEAAGQAFDRAWAESQFGAYVQSNYGYSPPRGEEPPAEPPPPPEEEPEEEEDQTSGGPDPRIDDSTRDFESFLERNNLIDYDPEFSDHREGRTQIPGVGPPPQPPVEGRDEDGDGFVAEEDGGTDCDDTNPNINPAAREICNNIDDNCNGVVDEDCVACPDADDDGFLDAACGGLDCDDQNPFVNPDQPDCFGDGVDVNCDNEDGPCIDLDNDGYCANHCDITQIDCEDTAAEIHPNADELCDNIDNDCDGEVDEGCVPECEDADGDGYADQACGGTDCNDADAGVFPGAPDCFGDNVDADCDGVDGPCIDADADGVCVNACDPALIDCDDTNPDVYPGAEDCYDDLVDTDCDGVDGPCVDEDGDGVCVNYCDSDENDCDDDNPSVYPGAEEICDGNIDHDCDGVVDEGCGGPGGTKCFDRDGDGYNDAACGGEDCDDRNPGVNPDAYDCFGDGEDRDCDGVDGPPVDADGDGYAVNDCDPAEIDCDDTNANVNPGFTHADDCFGDGVDTDCSGEDGPCDDVDSDTYCANHCTDAEVDCDDNLDWVNPGFGPADDCFGDGVDADCSGGPTGGEDGPAIDGDADGYALNDCDQLSVDCDDTDNSVNPGQVDCHGDGINSDCRDESGTVYAGVNDTDGLDRDGDGWYNPHCYDSRREDCCDIAANCPGADPVYVHPYIDPDYPGSNPTPPPDYFGEICGNGVDDDCDGFVDEDGSVDPGNSCY